MRATVREHRGELVSVASAVLLLAAMFALAWYGVDGIPGRTPRLVWTEDAWDALSLVRWLMLATVLAVLGSALLHFSQRFHGARTETGLAVTILGTFTAGALIYRVLIALPAPAQVVDQKLGGFVGVVCALGIAYGGLESRRAERQSA
jgi:hypothetical protein